MFLLEACVETIEAAIATARGGASRIELCADLARQGTTPADDLLTACLARVTIPVVSLIRPRLGGFHYADPEIELMGRQVHRARQLGARGIAVGALDADRRVDRDTMAALMQEAGSMSVTFHRAFDEVPDQMEALDALLSLGVARVLTSGGAATAVAGVPQIARLVAQAAGRIVILAGGGVRAHNVREIVRRCGVREVHARLDSAADARQVIAAATT
jgi:copper homeostasis protein